MKKRMLILVALFTIGLQAVFAQTKTVTGTVTSADDNSTLPGVSIVVKGTTVGTVTDFDGNYSIQVPQKATTLVFSFVGLNVVEKAIIGSTIDVEMAADAVDVGEVMVVAYGSTSKEAFTGSASVVGKEQLEQRAVTSVVSALEGTTTGVQMSSGSGQPGSSPSILIRGIGSLNGSTDSDGSDTDPLYVVDGVQYEGSISNLSSDDIASITILKDAASTSLYGARAANGVVLITTKSGKNNNGKLSVSVNASVGVVTRAMPNYKTAGPKQYYSLMHEAYKNSLVANGEKNAEEAGAYAAANIYSRLGYNPFDVDGGSIVNENGVINPDANVIAKGLDWYDAIEQTGYKQDYSVSVSGGGEKHSLFFSTSYLDEKGYVITSNYNRLTTRLNGKFNPTDWLEFGGNINLSLSEQKGPFSRGSGYANPFYVAQNIGSIYPVYLVDPSSGDYILDAAGERQYDLGEGDKDLGINARPTNVGRNVVAETLWNSEIRETNNISTRYNAKVNIIEGLDFSTTVGLDINDYISKEYENDKVGDGAPTGRYSEERYRRTVTNWNQILTYVKSFGEGHNFDAMLGHETFSRHYSEMEGMKNTQTVSGIEEFDNFSVVSDLSGYSSDKTNEGYFSRLNYNYNDKYYLSASYRRDGSSVFHADNRWGGFASVGLSWRMDQESFIENIDLIDRLKLRASFGQVGQDDLGDYYLSQPRYDLYPNAGTPGAYWSELGNNGLEWEKSESYDVALEFGLWNGKLSGSLEWYRKTSTDLLYDVPLAPSNGQLVGVANAATMYNQGFEIGLDSKIIDSNKVKWNIGIQASTLKNEITEIPSAFVSGSKRWAEGRSVYDFYSYEFVNVDSETGNSMYQVWETNDDGESVRVYNEDGTRQTTNDYTEAGKGYWDESSIPDLFGSVSSKLKYSNWSLDLLFTYSIGGKALDYGYASLMGAGSYGQALHVDQAGSWKKAGDITDIPKLENGNPNNTVSSSSRFLTDASYLALKNINLGYSFNKEMTDKMGITGLKLFLVAENVFFSTARDGFDPQYNYSGTPDGTDYKPSSIVSLGANLTF